MKESLDSQNYLNLLKSSKIQWKFQQNYWRKEVLTKISKVEGRRC